MRYGFGWAEKTRVDDGRDAPGCAVIDKHNTLNTGGKKTESGHDSRGSLHAETGGL